MSNVTVICTAADKAAAQAICTTLGDGPGTFSVPLSTFQNVTDRAQATHWGMSGTIPDAEVSALNVSLAPMVKVFALGDGQSFDDHLAMCTPTLYRIVEGI